MLPKEAETKATPEMPQKISEQIPPRPAMSTDAVVYPKLHKIHRELKQQNEIIFETEKERNTWEIKRDDLKGLTKFIKKGESQGKIDRKNEEIDILKIGLSGIVQRYGYQNVQEFYRFYYKSYNVYVDYKEQESEWDKYYGENSRKRNGESVREQLAKPLKKTL